MKINTNEIIKTTAISIITILSSLLLTFNTALKAQILLLNKSALLFLNISIVIFIVLAIISIYLLCPEEFVKSLKDLTQKREDKTAFAVIDIVKSLVFGTIIFMYVYCNSSKSNYNARHIIGNMFLFALSFMCIYKIISIAAPQICLERKSIATSSQNKSESESKIELTINT